MKKKLTKSKYNRKILGVCGGFAEYFDIDATLVRIISLFIVFNPPGLILYFICGIIMPEPDDDIID